MFKRGKVIILLAIILGLYFVFSDSFLKKVQLSTIEEIEIKDYSFLTKKRSDLEVGHLILVNNDVNYTFPKNDELTEVMDKKNNSYIVRDGNIRLNESLIEPLNQLFDDFFAETNKKDVMVLSAFRSLEDQTRIYNERVAAKGEDYTRKWVATPSGSEHHTGLAFDLTRLTSDGNLLDFDGTGAYSWIHKHANKYGFIVRYPENKSSITGISYEPWHFRYIGKPHAEVITMKDMVLEEYIDYLKQFESGKNHLQFEGSDGMNYEIYYVKATGDETLVPVPKHDEYEVSGNNVDGFIVTVRK